MIGPTNHLRWHLKKAGRKILALSALATGSLDVANRSHKEPRLRVLTYHRFGQSPYDPFCVSVASFEEQMAWLAHQALAVSLADVDAFLDGGKVLPDGAVLVTIDDGFESLHSRALPILQRYAIPAVAFITAGEVGLDEPAQLSMHLPERRMTWNELRALSEAGVTIGSHAWTHRSLGRLPIDQVREEAERSRETLGHELGQSVMAFAYPYGTRADYGTTTAAVLRATSYTCAFTSQHGAIRRGMDRFTLPRVKVEGGDTAWMFQLICRGGLDGWRWIDRTLWRLQASERIRGRQGLTGSRMVG
jgi:peptidoglycan/xylan/chitin deacetylase (PgdA/CDA1 family)